MAMVVGDYVLDDRILDAFAACLSEFAPEVLARLRPGLSEDEVRTKCASAGIQPSKDAVAWWTLWDGPALVDTSGWTRERYKQHARGAHEQILPGFQMGSLEGSLEGAAWWRAFTEGEARSLAQQGLSVDEVWPRSWIPMFSDGGGGHTILDCAYPDEPSALRYCFSESFSGSDWGKPIRAIGPWLAHATDWMRMGSCRYDPHRRTWQPHEAAVAYWPLFDPEATYDAWR